MKVSFSDYIYLDNMILHLQSMSRLVIAAVHFRKTQMTLHSMKSSLKTSVKFGSL